MNWSFEINFKNWKFGKLNFDIKIGILKII